MEVPKASQMATWDSAQNAACPTVTVRNKTLLEHHSSFMFYLSCTLAKCFWHISFARMSWHRWLPEKKEKKKKKGTFHGWFWSNKQRRKNQQRLDTKPCSEEISLHTIRWLQLLHCVDVSKCNTHLLTVLIKFGFTHHLELDCINNIY